MDPAGPAFLRYLFWDLGEIPEAARLNKNDAELVDVIHTDGDMSGTMRDMGHVDFYPGTDEDHFGKDQPGCSWSWWRFLTRGVGHLVCNHGKAYQLYLASITKKQGCYAAVKCAGFKAKGGGIGPGKEVLTGCDNVTSKKLQMGYWYDGTNKGMYGINTMSEAEFPNYLNTFLALYNGLPV